MSKKLEENDEAAFLQEFERRLQVERARLTRDLRDDFEDSTQNSYAELVGDVRDSADESSAETIADTERADLVRHSEALSVVDAALGRIRDGTYGLCADCGGKIAIDRLQAFPVATRCVECQTNFEKQHPGIIGNSL
jgi:DnaK suppressor protein